MNKVFGLMVVTALAVSGTLAETPDGNALRRRFQLSMDFCAGRRGVPVQPADILSSARRLIEYGVTNGMVTNAVVLFAQELMAEEYTSYKKLPDEQRIERYAHYISCNVLFGLLETARDPVSLDFLDAMRREQPSPFQSQAGYVFMQFLGNLPVAAIRAYLSDPEKAARVDMNGLCLMVDDKNRGSRASGKQGSEDVDDIYAFLLEHISNIEDVRRLLSLDRRLSGRYPEYKTSAQRLVVYEKGKNYEPPADWDDESKKPALAQKAELAELAKTPPEILTDMRQRFKNLPAPAAAEKEE